MWWVSAHHVHKSVREICICQKDFVSLLKQNIMNEQELYQDLERSIMIQDCNAIKKGMMVLLGADRNALYFKVVTICLN